MDQTSELEKAKRVRVSWKNLSVVRTFLDACIQEISLNGREGGSLKAHSWKKVAQVLNENHNFSVDRKQMKNHYDYLKGKYGAWLLLRNKTGNVYDPSTNTFNLTDEEWEIEMKKNRHVEGLRKTTLPFPDLCAQLFDGAMSTGIRSWGPSSHEPMPRDEPLVIEDDQEIEIVETSQPIPVATQSLSHPPAEKTKRKGKQVMTVVEEEIMGVLKIMAEKHNTPEPPPKTQKLEPPTFDDCLKRLDEIGWDEDNQLYDVALAIFCEPNDHYRQAWMKMKADKCANWVKMIGRSKGFMW
ncbi:Myb DNA-bind domain-containing protein [Artemisia annua]|uniref:Myb DNA-bind domain-containing protein n=1 Tax=Artemisia annua TaxID=35608 RepID=A0A2U1KUB5_ARTAN|nr:Myb DNA-bind domain-containing protein [Artemisia annua]